MDEQNKINLPEDPSDETEGLEIISLDDDTKEPSTEKCPGKKYRWKEQLHIFKMPRIKLFQKSKGPEISASDENPMDLKEAYQMLGIEKYPITYEEIREHFYKVLLREGESDEVLKKLTSAKDLIFSKMSENPFEENPEKPEEVFEKGTRESKLAHLKKPKETVVKRNWKDLKEQLGCEESAEENPIPILFPPEPKHKGRKILLLAGVVIVAGIFLIGILHSKNHPLPYEESAGATSLMTFETSLSLLARDGVTLQKEVVAVTAEDITGYTCRELFSLFGYHLIERQYTLHQEHATIAIKSMTVYKNSAAASPEESYAKKWETADYAILDARLDGEWTGTCMVDGKYELKEAVLSIQVTEQGYVKGTFSFITPQNGHGLLEMEGVYDQGKNQFQVNGTEWMERPSLFVTPKLKGYYDISSGRLTAKTSGTVFDFSQVSADNYAVKAAVVLGLIKDASAAYKDVEIPIGYLQEFTLRETLNGDECTITYRGVIRRSMIDYTVNGTTVLQKTRGIWNLKDNTAEAEFLSLHMSGIYTGTDWSGGKKWKAEYILIPTEDPMEYLAKVTLRRGFTVVKELRSVQIAEGGITTTRLDLFQGKLLGDGSLKSLVDYSADGFTNDGELTLRKRETW